MPANNCNRIENNIDLCTPQRHKLTLNLTQVPTRKKLKIALPSMTLTISKCKLSKQQHTIKLDYTLGENEKNSLIFTLMICRNFFAHRNAVCKTRDGLAHLITVSSFEYGKSYLTSTTNFHTYNFFCIFFINLIFSVNVCL